MTGISKLIIEPICIEVSYASAERFTQRLSSFKNIVYFHSARLDESLARYSILALDPYDTYIASGCDPDDTIRTFDILSQLVSQVEQKTIDGLPPFQGGVAGYLSYDCVRSFEKVPSIAAVEHQVPDVAVGVYDLVLSIDHFEKKSWIISSGLPHLDNKKRRDHAQSRAQWLLQQLNSPADPATPCTTYLKREDIKSNFTEIEYLDAVSRVVQYIKEGDIFEANLSQCFSCPLPQGWSPFHLFQKLMIHNPAPFSAFVNIGDFSIVSSSPERFIKIKDGIVEARPIKGTIGRSPDIAEDKRRATELKNSEKDNAENAMIVDLMRNDLSKICLPKSVIVEKLCGLESFETVHHLVSVIKGELKNSITFKDILLATLPGGSITGAPKLRAIEIIDEIEPTRRGAYCGNIFYYGFNHAFDSSILIRTYTVHDNTVRFQAGGAIVLDSQPQQEYDETLVKARALIKTLTTQDAL